MRPWFTVCLLAPLLGGCQPLTPGSSRSSPLASSRDAAPHDDDTFKGRLASTTRQVTDTVTKPFDPAYQKKSQQEAELKKRQKQQQEAVAKKRKAQQPRSPLMAWLFPEPKTPRTLTEWLSQERPES
jgi:hypothetical protein